MFRPTLAILADPGTRYCFQRNAAWQVTFMKQERPLEKEARLGRDARITRLEERLAITYKWIHQQYHTRSMGSRILQ